MSRAEREDPDPTSPFPLERARSEPPPGPRRSESETTGEHTGPFLLEREKPIDEQEPETPSPPDPPASTRLTRDARRARRTIAVAVLVHALVLGLLGGFSLFRWSKGWATPPELAIAVLSIGIALVHLRAGWRFSRLGRQEVRDGRLLAGAMADLRTVIVMKAIALFLALALVCFSLSMVISLVASI